MCKPNLRTPRDFLCSTTNDNSTHRETKIERFQISKNKYITLILSTFCVSLSLQICDVIKQNEYELINIDFEIAKQRESPLFISIVLKNCQLHESSVITNQFSLCFWLNLEIKRNSFCLIVSKMNYNKR